MFASSIPRLELGSFVLIGQLSFVHRLSKCCLGLLLCLQMNTTTATVEIKPATRPTTSHQLSPMGLKANYSQYRHRRCPVAGWRSLSSRSCRSTLRTHSKTEQRRICDSGEREGFHDLIAIIVINICQRPNSVPCLHPRGSFIRARNISHVEIGPRPCMAPCAIVGLVGQQPAIPGNSESGAWEAQASP